MVEPSGENTIGGCAPPGSLRDRANVAAVRIRQVDVGLAVAGRNEREPLAVRRPARRVLGLVAADRAASARTSRPPPRPRCRHSAPRSRHRSSSARTPPTCRPATAADRRSAQRQADRQWSSAAGRVPGDARDSNAVAASRWDFIVLRLRFYRTFEPANPEPAEPENPENRRTRTIPPGARRADPPPWRGAPARSWPRTRPLSGKSTRR